MADGRKANVFISWSGERSKHVASALREWLPCVIQAVVPWMSATDIDKGTRGLAQISGALEGIKVGISCLTPENQTEPWLLYEAGALTKTIDENTRLCTYLLGGLQPQDVNPPLGMFQHTPATDKETRKLLNTINKAVLENPLDEKTLDKLFLKFWPDLKQQIDSMPEHEEEAPKRELEEMIAEILEFTRAETNRRAFDSMFATQQFPVVYSGDVLPAGYGGWSQHLIPISAQATEDTSVIKLRGEAAPKMYRALFAAEGKDDSVLRTKRDGITVKIDNVENVTTKS